MNNWWKFGVIMFLVLSAPFSVYAAPSSFAKRQCQALSRKNPPTITIAYNYGELKYDNQHTSAELAEMLEKMHRKEVEYEKKINGLTHLSPYMSVESNIVEKKIGEAYCYYPQRVKLIVGYNPIVYIRNDLPENTCRYNVTLRHERTHLDIGDLSMQQFLRKMKLLFPRMVKDVGVVVKADDDDFDAQDASGELNDSYHKRASSQFNKFVEDMVAEQDRIDTEESYNFSGTLCPTDAQ